MSSALTETLWAFGTNTATAIHKTSGSGIPSGAAVVNTTELLWPRRWSPFFGFFLSVLWWFRAALACRGLPSTPRRRSAGLRVRSLSRSSRVARFARSPPFRRRTAGLI